MIPVSFFGFSNSGKTAVISEVVAILSERGFRVGVIKHSDKKIEMDIEGKDSWRIFRSGADVLVLSPVKMAFQAHTGEMSLHELSDYFRDYDVVIAEGFKKDFLKGVAVVRDEAELIELLRVSKKNDILLVVYTGDEGIEDFRKKCRLILSHAEVVSSSDVEKISDFVLRFSGIKV
jgi:molybdopterin-guanine dinucleotide biosynthesis protein B